ncbi:MAG: hypothetical protein KDD40_00130 [Bdellovibrionales bacterium]|nr:hypothetical protein [Bdellovibrionales bacterium]
MLSIFLLLLSWQLHAQSSTNSIHAQWLQKQYVTQKEAKDHSQDYSEVAFGWNYFKQKNNWEKAFDGQLLYSLGQSSELYLHLKDAYLAYNVSDLHQFEVGRKRKNWNQIDQTWALGLWEPSLKTDGFNFSREGLTGFYYDTKSGPWHLSLFASPIFLPDQGPQVKVEEGQIISKNRWFYNRVKSVQIGEIESPLQYNLHMPEISDIVQQNSVAWEVGWKQSQAEGLAMKLAFADKPINQLYIGVRPVHNVSVKNVNHISEIHLYPQVHKHRLYTGELSYKSKVLKLWLSANVDKPYEQKIDKVWISPPFVDENIYAIGGDWQWSNNQLGLSYLHRESEEFKNQSIFTSEDLSRLSDRYVFRQATLVNFHRLDTFGKFGQVKFNLRWVHSVKSDADMLSARWEYNYFHDWSWIFGGDLIGTKNENNNDFFAINRSNDRIYGGMSYVF